jgi:hypothetical protein
MNKRQRKKVVNKLLAEREYYSAVLANEHAVPRKPRLSARERREAAAGAGTRQHKYTAGRLCNEKIGLPQSASVSHFLEPSS